MSSNSDRTVHEANNNRYVVHFHDGGSGELVYQREGDTLHLLHSQVPAERQGAGLGGRLMNAALAEIENDKLKVKPVCRYTQHFIKRNLRWHPLLA